MFTKSKPNDLIHIASLTMLKAMKTKYAGDSSEVFTFVLHFSVSAEDRVYPEVIGRWENPVSPLKGIKGKATKLATMKAKQQ